jgi:hypothetical protein
MSEQLQLRRGASAQVTAFTGAQGEVIVDTTNNRLVLQDGATPGGFAAAKLAEVVTNARVSISDAPYTALTSDRTIAYVALTTSRVVTLPGASAYPSGTRLLVVDESGSCSAANAIVLATTGSDRINGATTAPINVAYGYLAIESNGAAAWTIVDQMAPPALATVAEGAFGASIQFGLIEMLVTLSGSSTTASAPIPANSIVFAVGARVVTAVTGAPSFSVGVSTNLIQFGSTLAVASGSTNYGLIGPTAFYAATPLLVTATTGSFTAGSVRLSIHYALMAPSTF